MENSLRFGLMAVFAVSGSMVFLVHQVHKRILSNFMKKFEFEMGEKHQGKKKVRFAKRALKLPLENKSCLRTNVKNIERVKAEDEKTVVKDNIDQKWKHGPNLEDTMPPNRVALYKGIMNYRNRRPHYVRRRF